MYVVIARYTVQTGKEAEVEAALRAIAPLSRAEPGCVEYRVQRASDDRSLYVLYEVYVDEKAYKAHTETEHFRKYVLETAVPLLASREREFFETLA